MKSSVVSVLSVFLLAGLVALSCTKEVNSKPNFIFKAQPASGAVAKISGVEISREELFRGVENDIYEAEMKVYEIKMNRLRAILLEKLMMADSRKKNLTNDEFLEKYIAKNVSASEKEIEEFIKERKIPKEHVNAQMKERIRKFLEIELKKKAIDQWMAAQTRKNPVEVYLEKPIRPSFEIPIQGAPVHGKDDAPVTLVEFSDFQCPFCAKGSERIQELKKKYGNKLKVVFKNFPLPFHNHAEIAAQAGMCAHEQGGKHFWNMHDEMFANQTSLAKEGLSQLAKKVGLEMGKFNDCLGSGKYASRVQQDMEDGKKIGVKSTPTFFVNGKIISGAQPLEIFTELIDQELGI